MRLLFVEDNDELAQLLVKGAQQAGYTADRVATSADARAAVNAVLYSAIVLDLGLPDESGLAFMREIRACGNPIPILILTARTGVNDRVVGLRSGADDYLTKPFALEELIARLQAMLRRPGVFVGHTLTLANLSLDTETHQIFVDGQAQVLSGREVAVLEVLLRHSGRVVTKKIVEDQLFGLQSEIASNAVEVYVHRLRRQLMERKARVRIHTLRGIGYLLTEEQRQ